MRLLPKILATVAASLLLLGPVVAAVEKTMPRGTDYVFELEGNPSTGYRWRLNEGASENLAIVKLEDLGYGEPAPSDKKLVGRPAPYRFRIIGVSPGFAKLHFEYVQPWVGKPAKTEELWVRVPE